MKIKELFEMLKIVGNVIPYEYINPKKIIDILPESKIIEGGFTNYKKDHPDIYKFDLSITDIWVTYRDCQVLNFKIEENTLVCDITVYDQNNYNYHKEERFRAKIMFPDSFIENIASATESKFNAYAEDAYEEYLEKQKMDWMENFKNKILKDRS